MTRNEIIEEVAVGGRHVGRIGFALAMLGAGLTGPAGVAAAAPVVAPVAAIDTTDRDAVLAAYAAEFLSARVPAGWTGSTDGCHPGTLADEYRASGLRRINYYRAMAGVPAEVVEDEHFSTGAQAAALVMQANDALDHEPPPDWKCWSSAAAEGARRSNLSLGRPEVTDNVDGQMVDFGESNNEVGHRAWLLRPNLSRVGIGHAFTASAIWVVDPERLFDSEADVRDEHGFVTWPPAGFAPSPLVFDRWSAHHLTADLSNATVEVHVGDQVVAAPVEFAGHDRLVFAPAIPALEDSPIDTTLDVRVSIANIAPGDADGDGEVDDEGIDSYAWETTVIAPPLDESQRFLAAAARDFLGRSPTWGELEDLTIIMHYEGRRGALEALAHSDAWLGGLVDGFYRSILGREPDAPGRQFWIDRFRIGVSPADLAASFYASQEHFQRSGNTNEAWVEALYREILGRPSDPSGHAMWVDTAVRAGRAAVALPFYQSLESRNARVTALYSALLNRAPDPGGLSTWAAEIGRTGNDVVLAIDLASSDEYFARAIE